MVTDINQIYCDHFEICIHLKSLRCTTKINIMLYVNHTSIKKRKVTYGGRSWGKQAGKLKLKGFREIEKKLPSTLRTTMSQEKHGSKNKHTARVIPLFEGAKKSKS